MSSKRKYGTEPSWRDVIVMQKELRNDFLVYVEFRTDFDEGSVRVLGRAYRIMQSGEPREPIAVAKVTRPISTWKAPFLPYWSVLDDIYNQLRHEEWVRRSTGVTEGQAELPF